MRPRPSSDSLHQWQRGTHGDTHLHSDLWRTTAQRSHRGASVGSPTAQSNRHIEENVVTPGTRSVRPLDPQLFRSNSGTRKNGFKHNGMGNTNTSNHYSRRQLLGQRARHLRQEFWSFHCPANGMESFRHRGPSPCRESPPRCPLRAARTRAATNEFTSPRCTFWPPSAMAKFARIVQVATRGPAAFARSFRFVADKGAGSHG